MRIWAFAISKTVEALSRSELTTPNAALPILPVGSGAAVEQNADAGQEKRAYEHQFSRYMAVRKQCSIAENDKSVILNGFFLTSVFW